MTDERVTFLPMQRVTEARPWGPAWRQGGYDGSRWQVDSWLTVAAMAITEKADGLNVAYVLFNGRRIEWGAMIDVAPCERFDPPSDHMEDGAYPDAAIYWEVRELVDGEWQTVCT
jgi:hypothetical protein